MSLQDHGFRFILRPKEGRVDGYWEHPATMEPGGVDVTNFSDDEMAEAVRMVRDGQDKGEPA